MKNSVTFLLKAAVIFAGFVIANSYITTIVEARKMCLYSLIPTTKYEHLTIGKKVEKDGYNKVLEKEDYYDAYEKLFTPPIKSSEERKKMYCHYDIKANGNIDVYVGPFSARKIEEHYAWSAKKFPFWTYEEFIPHKSIIARPEDESMPMMAKFSFPSSRRGGGYAYFEDIKFYPQDVHFGSDHQEWLADHPDPHFMPGAWLNETLETLLEIDGLLRPIDETELELFVIYYTYADWKAGADPMETFRQRSGDPRYMRPLRRLLEWAFRPLGF